MVSPDSYDVDRGFAGRAQRGDPDVEVPGALQIRLPAVAAASGLVRDRVRRWLDDLQWPREERDDVITAVSEGVENVISHAYLSRRSGDVILTGIVERAPKGMRQAALEIVDHGRWRPAPANPGYRGHGFTLIRASMASVRTVLTPGGTRLQMRSRPVPG